jgi:hypothetical protein
MTFEEITKVLTNNGWSRCNEQYWNDNALWEYEKGEYSFLIDKINKSINIVKGAIPIQEIHKWTSDKSIINAVKEYSKD